MSLHRFNNHDEELERQISYVCRVIIENIETKGCPKHIKAQIYLRVAEYLLREGQMTIIETLQNLPSDLSPSSLTVNKSAST